MMTGIPHVTFLKYFISVGKCQGSLLALPITLFSETATIKLMVTMAIFKTNLYEIRNSNYEIRKAPNRIREPIHFSDFSNSIFGFRNYTATGALMAGCD